MPKVLNGIGAHGTQLNGLDVKVYRFANANSGSTARTVTIETHMTSIFFECAKLIDATATLAATVGASTTYTGTITLAYSVAAQKTVEIIIVGTIGTYTDYVSVDADKTFDDNNIY